MWDLDTAGPSNLNINFVPDDPTGTFDFSRLADYGMDYDPVRDVFVLWGGDPMVWVLTPPDDVSATGWTLTPLDTGAAKLGLPAVFPGATVETRASRDMPARGFRRASVASSKVSGTRAGRVGVTFRPNVSARS